MIPSAVGSLSHRFLLAELRDGGVVVDTESGDVLHINKSASTICRVLLDPSSSADAVGETARLLDIDRPTAEQHVRDVLSALSQPRTRATPRQGLQYSASGSGFYLCYDGLVVLRVEPEEHRIRLVAPVSTLPAPVDAFVRQILPRLAFLKGVMVLHGAVVARATAAVAISGPSGAGKSTTAGALIGAGGRAIADDLIVVVPQADHVTVPEDAERRLNTWAAQASKTLAAGSIASTSDFPRQMTGPATKLTEIWFLDRKQRRPVSAIGKERLPPSRVLLRVLANSFVGSTEWSGHLRATQHLASTTSGYELTVPDTVAALQSAAQVQTTKVASYLFSDAATSEDNQA